MKRVGCPTCIAKGKDRSGDNLNISPDRTYGKCFACKSTIKGKELEAAIKGKEFTRATKSKVPLTEMTAYPIAKEVDTSRGVSDEILKKLLVRTVYSEETGKADKTVYSYVDNDGKVVATKTRKIDGKKFYWSGDVKKAGMYGKQYLQSKAKTLILVEGEEDVHAVHEMAKTMITKPDVLSPPNGSSLDDAMKEDIELMGKYNKIIIAGDNDEAGTTFAAEVADFLCPLADVELVTWALHKDSSDYLMSGDFKEWKSELWKGESWSPEGIVSGDDITLDELLEPMEDGVKMPFTKLNNKLHGLRKAEILTLCAASGIGKSTLARELSYSLNVGGYSVANIALEDQLKTSAQALIAMDMEIPLPQFRASPPKDELVRPHYDKMIANGRTHFFKHFGSLTSDTLMNRLYYYARAAKVDFIVLDHLSMAISGNRTADERKEIDMLMTRLAQLVVETGVGLITIVHLKRKGKSQGEKSLNEGGRVELTDLRGSSAIEGLSWSVVAMERNQQAEEGEEDVSTLRVLKNRTWGFTGEAGQVRFSHLTGRLRDDVEEDL